MRFEGAWNPNTMDEAFGNISMAKLMQAARVVKSRAESNLRASIGKGWGGQKRYRRISRPVYQTGPRAGQPYTSRDPGRLEGTIRITRLRAQGGTSLKLSRKKNVRIYAGSRMTDYHFAYEFRYPFLRPALTQSISAMRAVMGVA